MQNEMSIVQARTEERPYFHEFRKYDFMGEGPTMPKLKYDPFPNAALNDVVRTEIIATELVLIAVIKGPLNCLKMGMALKYGKHNFGLKKITMKFGDGGCIFDIEGSTFLTPCEPLKTLAKLRQTYLETSAPLGNK
jgi:hypothetical protein